MLTEAIGLLEWTAIGASVAAAMAALAVTLHAVLVTRRLSVVRPVDARGERIHRPRVFWQTWIVLCDTFVSCRRRLPPSRPRSTSRR